jgi:hypothetical protein
MPSPAGPIVNAFSSDRAAARIHRRPIPVTPTLSQRPVARAQGAPVASIHALEGSNLILDLQARAREEGTPAKPRATCSPHPYRRMVRYARSVGLPSENSEFAGGWAGLTREDV